MNANMKVSEQCRMTASKGNQVMGMIRRNITYKEKCLIIPLYKAIVSEGPIQSDQGFLPYETDKERTRCGFKRPGYDHRKMEGLF